MWSGALKLLGVLKLGLAFGLGSLIPIQQSWSQTSAAQQSHNEGGSPLAPSQDSTKELQPAAAQEPLLQINLPFTLIKPEIIRILTADGSPIKKINRLHLDPIQSLVLVDAWVELPNSVLQALDGLAGKKDTFTVGHRVELAFLLPSARKLAVTRFFQIEFVEFKIDQQNYLNALTRLNQFFMALLANSSFMDWVIDKIPGEKIEDFTQKALGLKIEHLLNTKDLSFRGQSLALRLDFSKIPFLSPYAELSELRLWQVTPLLNAEREVMLRVEAGLGIPHEAWFARIQERSQQDGQTLRDAQAALYQRYLESQDLKNELKAYQLEMLENFGLHKKQDRRQQNALERLERTIDQKISAELSLKNPVFLATPIEVYEELRRDARQLISDALVDYKRAALLEDEIRLSGVDKVPGPILELRLSQETLDQAVRAVRDFEFNHEQLFPEVRAVINPLSPGLIVRGIVNMDLAYFMRLGFEGEKVIFAEKPWRVAPESWGAGLPFELSLRLRMLDESVLGIDVTRLSLLQGAEQWVLDRQGKHGQALIHFAQMALVRTFAQMVIDTSSLIPDLTRADQRKKAEITLFEHLKNIRQHYHQLTHQQPAIGQTLTDSVNRLIQLAQLDLGHNPFLTQTAQLISDRSQLLLDNIIRYDEKTGLILVKVDPTVVSKIAFGKATTAQVWNIEPLYDLRHNRTYIDMGIGDGIRSKNYLQSLFKREEFQASQTFTGVDESRASSPRDVQAVWHLTEVEKFINTILMHAYTRQLADVNQQLLTQANVDAWLLKEIHLVVPADGVISFNATFESIRKKKHWIKKTYPVTRESTTVSGTLAMSVVELSRYREQLDQFAAKYQSENVYLGDELLSLDVMEAGLKFSGDVSIFKRIVSGVFGESVDFKKTRMNRWVKRMLLDFANRYLQIGFAAGARSGLGKFIGRQAEELIGLEISGDRASQVVSGIPVNRYGMLYSHEEEILIQVNPHFLTSGFEVRFIPNQKFQAEDLGFILQHSQNRLSIDFSTSGTMAAVDKGELLRIMLKADEIFSPFLNEKDPQKLLEILNKTLLADRVFVASDYSKLSLFHRLKRLLSLYPGVSHLAAVDRSVIDAINLSMRQNFGIEQPQWNSRQLSASGVELIYFSSAAAVIYSSMLALLEHCKSLGVSFAWRDALAFSQAAEDLRENYVKPWLKTYQERYSPLNARMIKQGVTDWNHSYLPDAQYSEEAFKKIQHIRSVY